MEQETIITRVMAIGANCERAVLYNSTEESLKELASLVGTAGGRVIFSITQNRKSPDPATFIGEGKLAEAKELAKSNDIELVVFDGELSPSQIRNLETELGIDVIDRSMLILDIFALHAVTNEGKLQVELAQLKYTMPRLYGKGKELSRLGGGIGTRGPGETKLETDRRHIRARISALKREIEEMAENRAERRKSRERSGFPIIAIIGYTNAGKSTLLNLLTGADAKAEDKLFATLDPTTRQLELPGGLKVLLTDTVGFIRNLPHHLIEAFASTLDEVRYSDLLLHVVDLSHEHYAEQMEVVDGMITELGGSETPRILVCNKIDAAFGEEVPRPGMSGSVFISAKEKLNIDLLLEKISETVQENMKKIAVIIPYTDGNFTKEIFETAVVHRKEYLEDGTYIELTADKKLLGRIDNYKVAKREQL